MNSIKFLSMKVGGKMTHKQFKTPDGCIGCAQFRSESLTCGDSIPRSKMKECICKDCIIKSMCDDACDKYVTFTETVR
jgi:hypothetical protein